MTLSVLALDYDGTIAAGDAIDPAVRRAMAAARTRGMTVVLVTGRTLADLRRVAGDLHFADAVVAENGAVTHFPLSGHTTTLAPTVPEVFLREIAQRGVAHAGIGECIVDADADERSRLLEVIRTLELPLVLAFNRGRVMVLPQGVSKGTGLQSVLDVLRRSARGTLAVGDAENDHELLRIAEVGAAVAWGSPRLVAAADIIVEGTGPRAIAGFLESFIETRRLPIPARPRRHLRLGYTENGQEFTLSVRGRNVLVAGDAKSGKSWIAGLLCEQLVIHGYSVCVLDPEGDYRTLEALPGMTILGGDDPPPSPRELLRALRYPDRSVVIDLSQLPLASKVDYIRNALPALNTLRRRTGLPQRILIDEAHYFLHESGSESLLDLDLNGYTIVTYCASRLPAPVLDATEVMLVTCESNPAEIDALCQRCRGCKDAEPARWRATLGRLPPGSAVALPVTDEAEGELRIFTIGPRITPHVRHRMKYVDVPVGADRGFRFADRDGHGPSARTLREFVFELERVPPEAVRQHLARHDFSRWIADVFGDRALAHELHVVEQARGQNAESESVGEIADAIRGRYDLTSDDDTLGPRS